MTKKPEIDFLVEFTQEELIAELQRIQNLIGNKSITKDDIEKYGRASRSVYYAKFGSFTKALLAAGLKPSRRCGTTNEELLNALMGVWLKTVELNGRRPFRTDLKRFDIPFSPDVYTSRVGSWRKALLAAYNFADKNNAVAEKIEVSSIRSTEEQEAQKREEISIRNRFFVFKRDQFTCVLCGRSGIGIKLEIDHKIPFSRGGNNNLDNLQTLCYECNRGKRNDLEE
jgi:5-methylcytosine-specific restriction endonuclease McrA